jgi:hypothetical protein
LPSKSSTETTLASRYLEEADLSRFDEFREPRLDLFGFRSKCGRPCAEAADRHHRQSILDDIGAGLLVARYRQHPALVVVVGLEERNHLLPLQAGTLVVRRLHSGPAASSRHGGSIPSAAHEHGKVTGEKCCRADD